MTTIGKSAAELAALVMERVRGSSACANLPGVRVAATGPAGSGPNWRVVAEERAGELLSGDCQRAVTAAEVALQKHYHLAPDLSVPPPVEHKGDVIGEP